MKILLTGFNGFLGEYIFEYYKHQNDVTTLGRKSGDIICDLSIKVPKINKKIDLVIHSAGKAHSVPKSLEESLEFHQTNFIGTQNLLTGLEQSCQIKYFVFISSVSVYGVVKGDLIRENSPLKAKDPYGFSKIQAENLIIEWSKKNNVKYTILRLPLIIGLNPPGNLGLLINSIKQGYYFNIAGGKAKKSMVLASDVAQIILKASEIGGIYNLTDGSNPNFEQLSKQIAKQLNGKSKIISIPFYLAKFISLIGDFLGKKIPLNTNSFNKIISDLTFDDSMARVALGWEPRKVLENLNFLVEQKENR